MWLNFEVIVFDITKWSRMKPKSCWYMWLNFQVIIIDIIQNEVGGNLKAVGLSNLDNESNLMNDRLIDFICYTTLAKPFLQLV